MMIFAGGGVIGIGLLFWLFMLFMLFFGFYWNYGQPNFRYYAGYHAAIWFCVFLLGWKVFGWPIGN